MMGSDDPKNSKQTKGKSKLNELKKLRKDLDKEFLKLIGEEKLSQLEIISSFTASVNQKLANHYKDIFPKKCNLCKKEYETLEIYEKETKLLANKSTIYDDVGLQEYRNCVCGSTLVVWTKDERRELTPYGKAKRSLFVECLRKLIVLSPDRDPSDVENDLRAVFSKYSE